jgi:phosphatidate phosphatase
MSSALSKKEAPTVSYEAMDMSAAGTRSHRSIQKPISLIKLIFDGASLVLVLALWLILKYFIKPIRRAFLCTDLNLYNPPPPKSVFPTWLLFVCAILIPVILILLSEGIRWYYSVRKQAKRVNYKIQIRSNIYDIPEWAGNLYIIIGVFAFANCVNLFITYVGKVSVGRLRPHFIPSCFNKFTYTDFCTNPTQWIANYTCIGESSSVVKEKQGAYDIRQSFPSGYASTAFCGLIFLALYIHKVWRHPHLGFFPFVLQAGCFSLAAYIGITSFTDNSEHASDVFCGAILGIVIAIIAFRYAVRSFKQTFSNDFGNGMTSEETDHHARP